MKNMWRTERDSIYEEDVEDGRSEDDDIEM